MRAGLRPASIAAASRRGWRVILFLFDTIAKLASDKLPNRLGVGFFRVDCITETQ